MSRNDDNNNSNQNNQQNTPNNFTHLNTPSNTHNFSNSSFPNTPNNTSNQNQNALINSNNSSSSSNPANNLHHQNYSSFPSIPSTPSSFYSNPTHHPYTFNYSSLPSTPNTSNQNAVTISNSATLSPNPTSRPYSFNYSNFSSIPNTSNQNAVTNSSSSSASASASASSDLTIKPHKHNQSKRPLSFNTAMDSKSNEPEKHKKRKIDNYPSSEQFNEKMLDYARQLRDQAAYIERIAVNEPSRRMRTGILQATQGAVFASSRKISEIQIFEHIKSLPGINKKTVAISSSRQGADITAQYNNGRKIAIELKTHHNNIAHLQTVKNALSQVSGRLDCDERISIVYFQGNIDDINKQDQYSSSSDKVDNFITTDAIKAPTKKGILKPIAKQQLLIFYHETNGALKVNSYNIIPNNHGAYAQATSTRANQSVLLSSAKCQNTSILHRKLRAKRSKLKRATSNPHRIFAPSNKNIATSNNNQNSSNSSSSTTKSTVASSNSSSATNSSNNEVRQNCRILENSDQQSSQTINNSASQITNDPNSDEQTTNSSSTSFGFSKSQE